MNLLVNKSKLSCQGNAFRVRKVTTAVLASSFTLPTSCPPATVLAWHWRGSEHTFGPSACCFFRCWNFDHKYPPTRSALIVNSNFGSATHRNLGQTQAAVVAEPRQPPPVTPAELHLSSVSGAYGHRVGSVNASGHALTPCPQGLLLDPLSFSLESKSPCVPGLRVALQPQSPLGKQELKFRESSSHHCWMFFTFSPMF